LDALPTITEDIEDLAALLKDIKGFLWQRNPQSDNPKELIIYFDENL
jgi:hypothetical protein